MSISKFLKDLREGKEPRVRYNVIVNGEWVTSCDDEEKAWDIAIGYQNDDSGYYGMYPNAYVETEYLDESLEESQSQEIGQAYKRLSDRYGIDFDELVYGRDGFMNSLYPRNPNYVYFPDFDGDVIYSEKHWNELVDWALKNKNVRLQRWGEVDDADTYGDELIKDFEQRHPWNDDIDENLQESKLNEAPDQYGVLTDDEIEAQERAEFEKRLAQRKALAQQQRDSNTKAEQERQVRQKAIDDAKAKGPELYDQCRNTNDFDEWFDYLVPSEGKANTVAGEIYRALARIIYRDFNDGDKFYEGYGRETCGSSAVYLVRTIDDTRITGMFYDLAEDGDRDDAYTDRLTDIKNEIEQYLLEHPDLFGEYNEEDSRDEKQFDVDDEFDEPKDYEYTIYLEDYYWTDPYGEDIYLKDYIDNEQCTIWKVQDTFEDFWFGDRTSFHIERPWSHYDDKLEVNDMNKDSYETIKEYAEDVHLFDELIEELYNKYGDPNAEDEYENEYEDNGSLEIDEEE